MNYSKCGAEEVFRSIFLRTCRLLWLEFSELSVPLNDGGVLCLGGELTKLVIQRRYSSIKPKNPEN